MKKRVLALLLAVVMVVSTLPVSAFAEENGEEIPETTAATEAPTETTVATEAPTETTEATTASEETTVPTETTAATEETTVPTETTEETEATEAAEETEPEEKTVTAWEWNDELGNLSYDEEHLIWVIPLIGASESNPAMWEDVLPLLPASITATLGEDTEELVLTWKCEGYPEETGAYTGSYVFTATLPEGYALAEGASALNITVELGGAEVYEGTGDFTVTGGEEGVDYTYEDNTLTILTETHLTVSGETTADKIVVQAENADLTIANLTIDVTSGNAIDIQKGSTLNLTLEGENKLYPAHQKAGIHVPSGADLTISGDGSLDVHGGRTDGGQGGAGIGANRGGDLGTITITEGTITTRAQNGGGAGIGLGGWGGSKAGSSITISGGRVEASAAAGGEGSFTAETIAISDSIVIAPDTKLDSVNRTGNYLLVGKGSGEVGGTVTLTGDWTVAESETLTVLEGATLNTGAYTLTNKGTLNNEGTITGKTTNTGKIVNQGEIEGTLINEGSVITAPGHIPENTTGDGTIIAAAEEISYLDADGNPQKKRTQSF